MDKQTRGLAITVGIHDKKDTIHTTKTHSSQRNKIDNGSVKIVQIWHQKTSQILI